MTDRTYKVLKQGGALVSNGFSIMGGDDSHKKGAVYKRGHTRLARTV